MSIADELRRDAEAALKEAGMYYSGEYLDGIAKRVEEVEAENAKLREQGARLFDKTLELATENAKLRGLIRTVWLAGDFRAFLGVGELEARMRELGVEVE